MPCNDGGYDRDIITLTQDSYDMYQNIAAMLCGIATVLEDDGDLSSVLDKVDWKESGGSKKKFKAWWASHKAADAERKAEEETIREKAERVEEILAKLTPEERKLIGINDH